MNDYNLLKSPRGLSPLLIGFLLLFSVPMVITASIIELPDRQVSDCDRECLNRNMEQFLDAMVSDNFNTVRLIDHAEVRQNTQRISLDQSVWTEVKAIRSVMVFSDPVTENVVSRAGVELHDGSPGYISTRLKIVGDNKIMDVEISADTSSRVVQEYVWNLDSLYEEVLPSEQRLSRTELKALGQRYFHSLSTHSAIRSDFDDETCNRYHSGEQITNTDDNTVEAGPPRTCSSSLEGDLPWGPATDQRFPVIDEKKGVVLGITLLHYPDLAGQPQMYVSEIFKVIDGKISRIDNIGLMMEGVETLGFDH